MKRARPSGGAARPHHESGRMHGDHYGPAPTLAELQRRVDVWIGQFEEGYWPPLSMLARLTEEVGELAREINHLYGHKPKKKAEPAGEVALEVADSIFVLVCLCNSLGIDLGDAFERVMQKYDARDARRWTRRDEAGPRSPRRKPASLPSPARRSRTRS
jgi:NTP pyrophosphatase (non-canonical NTP hydrolase)